MKFIRCWNATDEEPIVSMIFGVRKPRGTSVTEQEMTQIAQVTERYASDGTSISLSGRVGMGFQPCHTHLRSRLELVPAQDAYGNMLVFDGRLDNYQDLCLELDLNYIDTPDSQIVLTAYHRWGSDCFARLIGDWALALWSAKDQLLYLARDHAGTRTLYFENRNGSLFWATYLDSFFAYPRSIDIDQDYVACYLTSLPIRDLTPYRGIRAVLPAHYSVVTNDDKVSQEPHWQWIRQPKIRYKSDGDYDEHFLLFFGQSVGRRDVSDAPIVAQLSGGMDSSSIVCVSDSARRAKDPSADLLDTISFYDDSERSWNEKPYFSAVEAKRGKTGTHFAISFLDRTFGPHDPSQGVYFLPGADSSAIERERKLQSAIGQREYRSILSGIGGDEVLGGIPAPTPELADYLVTADLPLLFRRTAEWCLAQRSSFFQLLWDTGRHTVDLYRQPYLELHSQVPWVPHSLQTACADHLQKDVTRGRRLGLNPVDIENGLTWWSIIETLPHTHPGVLSRPEYRYPFLDRELVEYLFSIPREQLVRPGRRRALMRRALKNIVPDEILERRRKGRQTRAPLVAMQLAHGKIDKLFTNALISSSGFVDPDRLRAALELTCNGRDVRWWRPLMRAIGLELWLRSSSCHSVSNTSLPLYQLLLPSNGATKIRTVRAAG
jgi:asparagine synthase (glutamine-hydrolysing)